MIYWVDGRKVADEALVSQGTRLQYGLELYSFKLLAAERWWPEVVLPSPSDLLQVETWSSLCNGTSPPWPTGIASMKSGQNMVG